MKQFVKNLFSLPALFLPSAGKIFHIGLSAWFFRLIIPVLMFYLVACRDKYEDCTDQDYLNCNTERPLTANAKVLVTLTNQQPTVMVSLYQGDFENGNLVREREYRRSNSVEELTTEEYYSVTAMYVRGSDTTLVVDGGRIKILSYRMCEERCYEAKDLTFDLRLP